MSENMGNIIELIDDESGEAVRFQHLANIEYEGRWYIALAEENAAEEGECEVFIMEIAEEDDGRESYLQVEDSETQDAVFQKFLAMMEEAGHE